MMTSELIAIVQFLSVHPLIAHTCVRETALDNVVGTQKKIARPATAASVNQNWDTSHGTELTET